MKKLLLLVTLLVVNFSNSQETWFPLGPDDFNQPSFGKVNYSKITHDNNNVPYIAFSDVFNNDKISVRKFINNKWITVGSLGFSDGITTFISIDFDSNNIPYVAYKDTDIKIKKFDGTSWISVGNTSANTNFDFSFKIANNNVLYIAYQNSLNSNKACVKKFNGVNWELVGIDGISANQSNYISLDINNQNIPYIVYSDAAIVNKASVQKFNGSSWEYVGNQAFTLGESTYTSIRFDNNDIPFILYRDGATSGKATLQKFINNSWSVVGNSGFTTANALDLSFTFDTNNNPFVIYKTDNGFKYVSVYRFNNSNWTNVGNQYISDRQGDYSTISIDNTNNVFIAYKDVENGNVGVVKKFINNAWTIIGDEPFTKETSSIHTVTDSNNIIYVLHEEFFENTLTVKKYQQGQWSQVGNSLGGVYYSACDIAIDNNDNLYVVHYNTGVGNGLKVKKFDIVTNSWVNLLSTGLPAANVSVFYATIDINSDNEPIIVWKENTSSIIMKKFNGTNWVTMNSSTITGNIFYPVLKIDKNIVPNIIYLGYRNSNNRAVISRYNNSAWSSVGGSSISTGVANDISIDVFNNILYASFIDANDNFKISVKKFNGTSWENMGNLDFTASSDNPYLKIKNNKPYIIYQSGFENKVSLIEFNGTNWNYIGNQNFSSGKGNYPSLEFINNVPIAIYSGDKGSFAKYYGTENVLSLPYFSETSNFDTFIYPNPVLDKFKIKTDNNIINVKLYDILGKEINNINLSDNEINISFLNKGIYFLKIEFSNSTKTIRLIKN
ncbi:MAG: T9SS type A sorting domain-containing protein [Flavobacterium sp.]|nr:T9SS type A sorting domain-containing protein [Flavobacterium sp.]